MNIEALYTYKEANIHNSVQKSFPYGQQCFETPNLT